MCCAHPGIATSTPCLSPSSAAPLFTVFQSSAADAALPELTSTEANRVLRPLSAAPAIRRTQPPEDCTWRRRYDILLEDFARLEIRYVDEREQRREERRQHIAEVCRREHAELHAEIARHEIERLQYQMNVRDDRARGGRQTFRTKGQVGLLTTPEGLKAREEEKTAREKKDAEERAKHEEDEQRRVEDAERRRSLLHSDSIFSGRLNDKKRSDWEDLAFVLGLDISGNVPSLIDTIYHHLDRNQFLQVKPRYQQVWEALVKKRARAEAKVVKTAFGESSTNATSTADEDGASAPSRKPAII
jgi:hypothetical protein